MSKSKVLKTPRVQTTFGRSGCRFALQAQGFVHLVKNEQDVRVFEAVSKATLKRIWKDAFSVAGAVQETCS